MLSQSIQVLRRTNKHRISCFNQDMALISSKQNMMYIYHVYYIIGIACIYICVYNYIYISCKWCKYIYIHSHYFWQNPFSTLASTYHWWNPDPFEESSGLPESATCRAMTHMCRSQGSWYPRSWRLSLGRMDDNGIV